MVDQPLVWAKSSDEDSDEESETEAHGDVDDTFAKRRLRRWLEAMFGGQREPRVGPQDEER